MTEVTFIRGNVVEFSTQFFAVDGTPSTPVSASVNISIAAYGAIFSPVDLAMTQAGDVWTATWDTTDVPPGTVFWSVKSVDPHSAEDGRFELSANYANVT